MSGWALPAIARSVLEWLDNHPEGREGFFKNHPEAREEWRKHHEGRDRR
jgi:uncharacterized protein YigA (DUF484 family)